jgi:transposase
MGLGRRPESRQQELWIAADRLARTPRHVFYEKLNRLLAKARFDAWIEERCGAYYAEEGRRSIPPGVYFRMLLVGYFEGIDSQRGIAWRCADSLSLKAFLGYGPTESTPDHSSLTKIRERLPAELYDEVFQFVLQLVEQHKLLSATVVGVDSTTLEANAAMKSIVRKDTGENWNQYVTRLMREEGVISPEEEPSADELRRYDRKRKDKKVSNDDWENPHDPEAKITKMKDGRTHLAYKAEHVVDLKTEAILAAEIYPADAADTATLVPSLEQAQANVESTENGRTIEKAAADKGYHAADTLVACQELDLLGVKTYIPEPRGRRRWTDKTEEQKVSVLQNRARTQRAYGKQLQRLRSELVERSFAHVCDTGGGRRSWLRGLENVRKRHLLAAAAHNLGLILRKLLGAGKPRAYDDLLRVLESLHLAQLTLRAMLPNLPTAKLSCRLGSAVAVR